MLDEHEGAIDLPSTASAAPALTTLKPQQCRRLGPDHLAPAGQRSVMAACLRGQAIPPDPHAARRLQAMAARGERLHGMADLATMYRNRLLVMIGDSMSFQVTEAMRCAAASAPGGVRTVTLQARAPPSMVNTCRFLMREAGQERACGCHASADKAWRASSCGLWASLQDLEATRGAFTAMGFFMPAFNFTFS